MLGEINTKPYCKSEHRVLKKVFLPKRDKVAGQGEQHSVECRNFYFSPNNIRVMK